MRRPLIQPPWTPVLAAVAAAALVAAGLVVAALNDRAVEAQRHQDAVLRAMGWYVDPPQPRGYPLTLWDESLLAAVRQRGKLWRG